MNRLPLFPLSIVVFPGEELRLHIFEPRYRQMVQDCIRENITFGITPYLEGQSLTWGTELRLLDIVKIYEDGKMDIKAIGIGWFEIKEFYRIMHGKLYPGGVVQSMPWNSDSDIVLSKKIIKLIDELYTIMKITNVEILPAEHFKTYQIAHKLGMNITQEIELLTISNETEKQMYLINHLETLIPVVREAENLRKRAELNGHYQNIIPPSF
ncbi:MAG: peptidase [Saprospiraceae bacterium]|nr:peptidase [Saprospiraceae bacterium]